MQVHFDLVPDQNLCLTIFVYNLTFVLLFGKSTLGAKIQIDSFFFKDLKYEYVCVHKYVVS